jgi:DNA-binding transcriptional ArsR family regulator
MSNISEPYEFEGFLSPNTTPVPDVLFDELLLRLDNAELRVLLYIIRRTYGFKKSSDDISIGQMVDGIKRKDGTVLDGGTGMAKSSVTRALSGLLAKKIIIARRNQSRERGNEPTTYALRLRTEEQLPLVSNAGQAPLVPPVNRPLSHGRDTQETVKQQTDLSNIRTAAQKTNEEEEPSSTPSSSADLDTPKLGITLVRGGVPKPVGDLLNRYRKRLTADERDERAAITAAIQVFAPEFGDKAPVKSSITRMYNLYKQSQLALAAFVAELYGVRSPVRDIAKSRNIQNEMSYFFSLLEDRLGLSSSALNAKAS